MPETLLCDTLYCCDARRGGFLVKYLQRRQERATIMQNRVSRLGRARNSAPMSTVGHLWLKWGLTKIRYEQGITAKRKQNCKRSFHNIRMLDVVTFLEALGYLTCVFWCCFWKVIEMPRRYYLKHSIMCILLLLLGCDLCEPGTYARGFNHTICEDCPAGTFSNTSGATDCLPCPVNYFSNDAGSTSCTACGAGTFQVRVCECRLARRNTFCSNIFIVLKLFTCTFYAIQY